MYEKQPLGARIFPTPALFLPLSILFGVEQIFEGPYLALTKARTKKPDVEEGYA